MKYLYTFGCTLLMEVGKDKYITYVVVQEDSDYKFNYRELNLIIDDIKAIAKTDTTSAISVALVNYLEVEE